MVGILISVIVHVNWDIIIFKQIHTFASIVLFQWRRSGRGCPSLCQVKQTKAGATQT